MILLFVTFPTSQGDFSKVLPAGEPAEGVIENRLQPFAFYFTKGNL